MTKRILTSILVVSLIGVAGCSKQAGPKTDSTAQTPPASASVPPASTAAPTGDPAPGQSAVSQTVSGVVVETMNASNYTYVRVKTDAGEFWAATSQFKVAVGDRVVVPLEMPMSNFQSPSLKRTFPLIYFVTRIAREGEATQPAMMSAHGSAPAGSPATGTEAAQPVTKVEPAAGGMTVADVWAKRKTLGGKTVTIRGKVVKFNGGILGVNWLHIQDGTGAAKDGTNDITVTSQATAKVGDVVTVTGKIALEKDLGSGYSYPVILEGATITVK